MPAYLLVQYHGVLDGQLLSLGRHILIVQVVPANSGFGGRTHQGQRAARRIDSSEGQPRAAAAA